MEAFLSHSNNFEDTKYVDLLCAGFYGLGIDLYVAERPENTEADIRLEDKLKNHINQKDIFVVLYTKYVQDSPQIIHEEMAIARQAGKTIIAIVEKGIIPKGVIINEREQLRCIDRAKDSQLIIKDIINRIKSSLDLYESPAKANKSDLNEEDFAFLDYLLNQDYSYARMSEIISALKLAPKKYNLIKKKLERNDYIIQESSWEGEEGWTLTDEGHMLLERLEN